MFKWKMINAELEVWEVTHPAAPWFILQVYPNRMTEKELWEILNGALNTIDRK